MKALIRLYPAAWRARYGVEFEAVLDSQRASLSLVLDVIAGALDAHLAPQFQPSPSTRNKGSDTMTRAMLFRCAAGGPKLSPDEKRVATRLSIMGSLAMALLYLVLTKIYRGAPAVQALFYTSFCATFAYRQIALLRNRMRLTKAVVIGAEVVAMYLSCWPYAPSPPGSRPLTT